jgi:hypothetical protein
MARSNVEAIKRSKLKGYSAAFFACLIALLVLWNWLALVQWMMKGIWLDSWVIVGQFWRFAFLVYLALVAHKHLASSQQKGHWPKAGWGRIVLGTWLLFSALQQQVHPTHGPYEMKPSNDVEAAGMLATRTVLMPGLGVGLLVWGIARAFSKDDQLSNS